MKHAIIIATLAFHLTTVAQNQTNVVNQQSTNGADQLIELKKSLLSETKDHQQFLENSTKDYTKALLSEADKHRSNLEKEADRTYTLLRAMLGLGPTLFLTVSFGILGYLGKYVLERITKKGIEDAFAAIAKRHDDDVRKVVEESRIEVQKGSDELRNVIAEHSKTLESLGNAVKHMSEAHAVMCIMSTALGVHELKNEESKALLNVADARAEEFLKKDYIIYINDEMFRMTTILLGRIKVAKQSLEGGLSVLERGLTIWTAQNRSDPIHKGGIIFNKACYLNLQSRAANDENEKARLKSLAIDALAEACKLDKNNIKEAKNDSDVSDIINDVVNRN